LFEKAATINNWAILSSRERLLKTESAQGVFPRVYGDVGALTLFILSDTPPNEFKPTTENNIINKNRRNIIHKKL
jgi:hypothetical protein